MSSPAPANPLMIPHLLSRVLDYIKGSQDYKWDAQLAQLYALRGVCTLWMRQVDDIFGRLDSLSLLPTPYASQSDQYYSDSLHAALFHLTPSSYLGSPHFYNLFEKGRIRDDKSVSNLLVKFPKLKYLSIVELNKGILDLINSQSIQLEGLALDTLDESSISAADLKSCCFRSSLRILSFSFYVHHVWIVKLLSIFESLEVIHFASTSISFTVPFEILHSINCNIKAVYLGNRMVTFDGATRKSLFASGDSQLQCLEMMSSMAMFPHQQETLFTRLSSLRNLSYLHLDLSNLERFHHIKSIGKIANISSLKLILPSSNGDTCSLFPLQDALNVNLKKLVLVGRMQNPVLTDSQIADVQYTCPALEYLCVNALIYTVNDADDYMLFLNNLTYLKDLHIGYRPLVEQASRLSGQLEQLSRNFTTFKLLHWCDTHSCGCSHFQQNTVHKQYCNCSYFDPTNTLTA